MSHWLPALTTVFGVILTIIWGIYNKVTTPEATKEHLRKIKEWLPKMLYGFGTSAQIVGLILDVRLQSPITRLSILKIAADVTLLLMTFLGLLLTWMLDKLSKLVN